MKELDKNKAYYLGDLSNNELKTLWIRLKTTDYDWKDCSFEEVCKNKETDCLSFKGNWEWDNTIKKNESTNAKELFEPQYEVTMIAEAPKPTYYQNDKNIDVIDICKILDLNFNLGNVLKYISRSGKKDGESTLKELKKALDYIQREIKYLSEK